MTTVTPLGHTVPVDDWKSFQGDVALKMIYEHTSAHGKAGYRVLRKSIVNSSAMSADELSDVLEYLCCRGFTGANHDSAWLTEAGWHFVRTSPWSLEGATSQEAVAKFVEAVRSSEHAVVPLAREHIVSAAIRVDGIAVEGYAPYKVVLSVERPGRHHHVAWWLGAHEVLGDEQRDQGFITNTGRFVDRKEGCIIARAAGQLEGRTKTGGENTLYSEDLW
jgi:hypothetical protein